MTVADVERRLDMYTACELRGILRHVAEHAPTNVVYALDRADWHRRHPELCADHDTDGPDTATASPVGVLAEVDAARDRHATHRARQDRPDGTGVDKGYLELAAHANATREWKTSYGTVTWADILRDEAYTALAEADPAGLRAALVSVAAVALDWIDDLDRRDGNSRYTAAAAKPGATA